MYRNAKFRVIVLLIILVSLVNSIFATVDTLEILSPNYFGEQKNIYDEIHYLENEYLSFKFCTSENALNVNFSLVCSDKTYYLDVNRIYDEKGCYFSNYDMINVSCSTPVLELNYDVNNKKNQIRRYFKKQKESLLINHILDQNYQTLSDKDLSYYLVVLNDIQDKGNKENVDAYEKLKIDRDNEDKCWPKGDCDLDYTTEVLRNLKIADYESDSRMIDDGKIYLERQIIDEGQNFDRLKNDNAVYDFEIKLNHTFTPSEEIGCKLTIDNDDERNYEFDDGSDRGDLTIDKSAEDSIKFDCDENVDEMILSVFGAKLVDKDYTSRDEIKYELDSSDKDDYSDFNYRITVDHNFGSNEEIECDLSVDGGSDKTYTFDDDSDASDLVIEGDFSDKVDFSCDDDLDNVYFEVYADEVDNVVYTNEDKFDYDIDTAVSKADKFDFDIGVDYDFRSNEEIECKLTIDGGTPKIYRFNEDDEGEILIDNKDAAKSIKFECDETLDKIRFRLYDIYERKQVDQEYLNKNTFTYNIPSGFSSYSCIGDNNVCDYSKSLESLITYGSNIEDSKLIGDYVDSLIFKDSGNKYYINTDNKILDTGRYLYYKSNNDLMDFLKFEQNNDGSWGSGVDTDKIEMTSWAVLGLQNVDKDSEHVSDGKKWIYYNEPNNGWGSVEKNSLAYIAIKEKLKPYLKFTSQDVIRGIGNFEIQNPTIYNLRDIKLSFDSKVNDYISYKHSLGDLEGQDKIRFNVTVNSDFYGVKSGVMKITGIDGKEKEIVLVEVPVNIVGDNPFSVVSELYKVSDQNAKIIVHKKNNVDNYNYVCSYKSPFSGSTKSVTISSSKDSFEVPNEKLLEGNFTFDLRCKQDKDEFVMPMKMKVVKAEKTIDIPISNLILDSYEDFSIDVHNLFTDKQVVTFRVEGNLEGVIVPMENNKILAKNETREVFFSVSNPEYLQMLGNSSTGSIVFVAENGYERKIPVEFYVAPVAESNSLIGWYIAIGIVAFLIILVLIVRRYNQMKAEEEERNQANEEEYIFDDFDF